MTKYFSQTTVALSLLFLAILSTSWAKTVSYNLVVTPKTLIVKDEKVKALSYNNKIPGPTLYATVGDMLEVSVTNNLEEETSVHWHGVLLPNDQDGVPYLTTPPIKPGGTFTYKYEVTHPGTYWYHSHSGLQEQLGLYGSLVFLPKETSHRADHDYVVVLSDWINEPPGTVTSNIKRQDNYYALKKNAVQSWLGVIENGWPAIKSRLEGAWDRMGPMDISDVGYDAFWANGKPITHLDAKPGDTVRIRLINAGASTYFYLQYAGGPMTIVAADGVDVEPVDVNSLKISVAETYDVLVKVPLQHTYELRATAEDGTGYSSIQIGEGSLITAPDMPKPNIYLSHSDHGMNHAGNERDNQQMSSHGSEQHGHIMSHNTDKHAESMDMNEYDILRATSETALPAHQPWQTITLKLTGNMERYVWTFNNETLSEADKILIKKGENVRFILKNETMMHHPIHLHGHFFRVVNKHGDYSPLKHTVNVPPMSTVEIEFDANEEKDWFFHCHNLYHVKTGMARIVSYEGSTTATDKTIAKLAHDTDWFQAYDLSALSNMTYGHGKIGNTRNAFMVDYEANYEKEYDVDLTYDRNISRYLDIYGGVNFERADAKKKGEAKGIVGLKYVLPLLIESDLRLDDDGHVRLRLGSELQLTDRSSLSWQWDTDHAYRISTSYELQKDFYLSGVYDSENKLGIGIRVKF